MEQKNPVVWLVFGRLLISNQNGVVDFLNDPQKDGIIKTDISNLCLLPAGKIQDINTTKLINNPEVAMVEIGGKPILWHIMKHYSVHNINDFVICLGYKGDHFWLAP